MKTLPPILIVTDRGHFVAYRLHPDSSPEVVEHATIAEGVQKLSEQVTDQAGGFPAGGTAGQGNSAAERLTLVNELEYRCFRQIGELIQSVLSEHGGPWGFAAPSEINAAILGQLPKPLLENLRINLPKDIARVPAPDVPPHFLRALERN